MGKGKKAMLEVSKMKMTPALSAEHQRKWDESRWELSQNGKPKGLLKQEKSR